MLGRWAQRGPRILVDSGNYQCSNLGDLAMLQTTVTRLRELWPTAAIEVITQDPEALALHCPGTVPVPWRGREIWLSRGTVLGSGLDKLVRRLAPQSSPSLEAVLRRRTPALLKLLLRGKLRLRGHDVVDLDAFLDIMLGADLVVLAGAGGFTDHAVAWAIPVLELLELSAERRVPTAIFSHGLGPLQNPALRLVVKRVLPKISVVALREKLGAIPLMESLGVAHDRVIVTGDDAIELAYSLRPATPGTDVGVNLRVAKSSDVDQSYTTLLRPVLHKFARERQVRLLPVPIAHSRSADDARSIHELIAGATEASDDAVPFDTTQHVVEQVGRCRIVVSGAYHAAVFSLSQGIPVVCLAKSAYFAGKFSGLSDQFGVGCTVVDLSRSDCAERLETAMNESFDAADDLRGRLLEAAVRQIGESRRAYRQLTDLLGGTEP